MGEVGEVAVRRKLPLRRGTGQSIVVERRMRQWSLERAFRYYRVY